MTRRPGPWTLLALAGLLSCYDTTLPAPPEPGTVSGAVVVAVPGWSRPRPAVGAVVEVLGTSQRTVVDDADGRFVLEGFHRPDGTLAFAYDADGDGEADARRFLPLAPLKVGPGRDVALGEVVLGRNARLLGRVRPRPAAAQPSGHAGTTVFVKGTAFLTFSADDGHFTLADLPEGTMDVVFFRDGFEPLSIPVDLGSGEERQLADVELEPAASTSPARLEGSVLDVNGAGLPGARVSSAGPMPFSDESAADGTFARDGLPAGVYHLAFEKAGFRPVVVEGVLLAPGPQVLDPVTLVAGESAPVNLQPPPTFDGGGPFDGGLDCAGACAPGTACSARVECQTAACGLSSCAGPCNDGRCYATHCGGLACPPGDVCDGARCVPLACAGVTCPALSTCAAGRCVSTLCAQGPCPQHQACVAGRCTDVRCVDVACGAGATCVGGTCLPSTSTSGPCAPGALFVGGRCVDPRCQGVSCPAGAFCQAGGCTASGLFAAGQLFAEGRTSSTPETVILGSGPGGWRRLNLTTLPRVLQLGLSRDGQWLFAVTDDASGGSAEGSVWRSTDGVVWLQSWAGDPAGSGAVAAIATDHQTGSVLALINGGPQNLSAGVICSDDDGATWVTAWQGPVINGVLRERVTGVSPSHAVISFSNFSASGVYPLDGGPRMTPHPSGWGTSLMLFDPLGLGRTYLAGDQLRTLDGGLLGPMSAACPGCVSYAPPPATLVHVAANNAIWFSADGEQLWGLRALPQVAGLALTGLAQGASGGLYASNSGGLPPLLESTDDGVSWGPLGDEWSLDETLCAPYPAWQPDASYAFQQRVRPTVPNGFAWERGAGPGVSGFTEPAWPTDGGAVREANGVQWNPLGRVKAARLTALVSRACDVGRQRCGSACVDVTSDPQHCGACGVTCAGPCRLGQCLGADAGGTQPGCADGTREGFVDDVAWPDLAACAGRWPGELTDAAADALCGAGFHVCTHLDTELSQVGLDDARAFPGCFAYRASNDGFDGCDPLECQGNPQRDDVAGLGRTCFALAGVQPVRDGGASCLRDGARVDAQCCAASVSVAPSTRPPGCHQRGESGVVCCRD